MKGTKERKQISAAYMSDEETDSEEGLNLLITHVDKWYKEDRKVNREKPRESRRLGVPSARLPPANGVSSGETPHGLPGFTA